jgi:hypothetical protein
VCANPRNFARRAASLVLLLGYRIFGAFGPWKTSGRSPIVQFNASLGQARMVSLLAVLFGLSLAGQGCPHEGADHRLFGRVGCPIQRKLTIEGARPPRTIWSFRLLKVSVKIDPKHPHLLIEWPARSRWWRFRVGYRWDANAKAYIFPSLALKRVDGPMHEYQTDSQRLLKPT